MATIIFQNGTKVQFNGTPTPQDVEEVAAKLNLTPAPSQPSSPIQEQKKPGILQSLAQSVAKPFLRAATTAYDAGRAGYEALGAIGARISGDKEAEQRHIMQGYQQLGERNFGYFGTAKPVQKPGLDMVGTGLELGANFIGGEGTVGIGKNLFKGQLAKAVGKGFGVGAVTGGLTGAGEGLQADKPTVGKTLLNTGIGMVGGGLTGGILSAIPAAGVESVRVAKAFKNFISPDVEVALTKAIKPLANNTGFKDALKTAIPDIATAAEKLGKPVNSIEELGSVIKTAKQSIWQQYEKLLGKNAKLTIDGNYVADAMLSTIDKRTRLQNPGLVDSIEQIANTYRRKIPVQEAEEFLQAANNDLHSYYAKNKVGQKVAMGDPAIAHTVKEADALRESLYKNLSHATNQDVGKLKNRYGSLTNIENEVTRRANVAARQNPDSLAEQIGFARGAAKVVKGVVSASPTDVIEGVSNIASSRYLKQKNTSDALVATALGKMKKNPSRFGVPSR